MTEYKKMLDEKIEYAQLGQDSCDQGGFSDGANLLAPMLLEAIEKLEYVSLHLEDGYIVDEVIRKFEEFCK
jgi:predicted esterase